MFEMLYDGTFELRMLDRTIVPGRRIGNRTLAVRVAVSWVLNDFRPAVRRRRYAPREDPNVRRRPECAENTHITPSLTIECGCNYIIVSGTYMRN